MHIILRVPLFRAWSIETLFLKSQMLVAAKVLQGNACNQNNHIKTPGSGERVLIHFVPVAYRPIMVLWCPYPYQLLTHIHKDIKKYISYRLSRFLDG